MSNEASVIDAYLSGLSADKRSALQRLRTTIQAAAPEAEESLSYGLPAFRLKGRPLVSFGAAANHCALYPMSTAVMRAHQHALKGFDTSKGTIRFQADAPLPEELIRIITMSRVDEVTLAARRTRLRQP